MIKLDVYPNLYVSPGWEDKTEQILGKLRAGEIPPLAYVVALSQGEQNHLEFFSAAMFLQEAYRDASWYVVGLARGREGALKLVEQITADVYAATGGTDIRTYINLHGR